MAKIGSRWLALGVLVLAVLLIAVDATVLALAVPFLAQDLRPDSTELLWIGDVYSFVLAGLLVTMGTLGDRIGRKRLLLIGAAGFGVFSVLAGYAPNPATLIAARALLGVAGATLMPSTLSIIRNMFTDARERSLAIGVWGAMAAAGMAVGPVIGGALLEHFWWGSVFLVNLPVMVLLIGVGIPLLPESRDPNPGRWDLASAGLSLLGVLGVVYAVKTLAADGWRSDVPVAAVLGVLALTWFVRRQLRRPDPLVDLRLFADRRFAGAVLATVLSVLGLAGVAFFMSQFLQLVQGYRPMRAGLAELPAAIGATVTGVLAGFVVARSSPRVAVSAGLGAMGVALLGVQAVHTGVGYPLIGAILLVVGLGVGLSFTVNSDLVLTSAPKEKAGAASAISETAYELGAALGIALLGSVLTAVYRWRIVLPDGLPADVRVAGQDSLAEAASAAHGLPTETAGALVHAAQEAFVAGLRVAAGVAAVLVLLAAVGSWLLLGPNARLGEPADKRVDRRGDKPVDRPAP